MIGHKAAHKGKQYAYWISAASETKTTPLLLIHGFGGTYSGLEDLSAKLDKTYTVIGVDLPGYGLSEPLHARHTLGAYASFLNDFCEETGFPAVHVVGHSFGADISMVFASKYPERVDKLVLLNPVLVSNRTFASMAKYYYELVAKAPYKVRHWLLHNHVLTWVSAYLLFKNASPEQRAKILRDDYISDHLMTDRPVIESYRSLLATDFLRVGAKIKSPTLIASGTADSLSPPADMAKLHDAISGSRLEQLHGEGHFMPIESPAEVYRLINNFIA